MFKYLLHGALAMFFVKLLDNYRQLTVQLLKIEALKCYLHAVQLARVTVLSIMGMGLLTSIIGLGVLLIHVCAFLLLPWSTEVKAVIGLCLGVLYVLLGVVVVCVGMREKTWLKMSGAVQWMEEATEPQELKGEGR